MPLWKLSRKKTGTSMVYIKALQRLSCMADCSPRILPSMMGGQVGIDKFGENDISFPFVKTSLGKGRFIVMCKVRICSGQGSGLAS